MNPSEIESRLAAIEMRLTRLEAALRAPSAAAPVDGAAPAVPTAGITAPAPTAAPRVAAPRATAAATVATAATQDVSAAGNLLGWAGAFALVLAASYLIRLGIDSGWLTPARQLGIAACFGCLLIACGFLLGESHRRYAGLLPAAGVAILFMTVYGAHLHFALIGVQSAFAMVVLVCVLSLWLCRVFESDLYALLAVVGSYSAPFLLSKGTGSLTDLALYFSLWSVVFSVFALWRGRRAIYLLALYLALIGFDAAALRAMREEWVAAIAFQTVQFAIFGMATALFSIRRAAPLTHAGALAHLPALLLFYALQYHVLKMHLPAIAPWIAVGSLAAVAALYAAARYWLDDKLPGGAFLLWSYAAVVLLHAGFIESVPAAWAPWVALVALPLAALATLREDGVGERWPVWVVAALFFGGHYLGVLLNAETETVVARNWLPAAYAALLYVGVAWGRASAGFDRFGGLLLYMGHLMAMAAIERSIDERILQSGGWGCLAIVCLVLAWRGRDKFLAQSSLVVFAATALKVMMVDLRGAEPLARIIGLVVIGVTFYTGGLLYRWVAKAAAENAE